jgi:hypothetical protein
MPAPLIEDQIEAGAQPVPALLERRDARVAAADLERYGAGGKCGSRATSAFSVPISVDGVSRE